jgi:hypothetical protein
MNFLKLPVHASTTFSQCYQDDDQLLPGEPVSGGPADLCLVSLDVSDPPGAGPHLPLHLAPRLLQAGRLLPRPLHRGQRAHPLCYFLRQVGQTGTWKHTHGQIYGQYTNRHTYKQAARQSRPTDRPRDRQTQICRQARGERLRGRAKGK